METSNSNYLDSLHYNRLFCSTDPLEFPLPKQEISISKSEVISSESPILKPPIYQKHPLSTWQIIEGQTLPNLDDCVSGDKYKFLCKKNYYNSPQKHPKIHHEESSVWFHSQFESGNLLKAYEVRPREFVLILQQDTETNDYCHWYYFKTKPKTQGEVLFHIINMMRPEPLIFEGMKPLAWSKKKYPSKQIWEPVGSNIKFNETVQFESYLDQKSPQCYTLSFTYSYKHQNESVYFSYCYPYTFSSLNLFLGSKLGTHHDIFRVNYLATTLTGNSCDYLVITNEISKYETEKEKKAVFVTARIHPGETPSSYIMEGITSFLLSADPEAENLRNLFVFFLVPMLNPDGVRHGNYRCSALGVDLNRRWMNPHKALHPTLFYTKELIESVSKTREIAMFCDCHGHSKRPNVFMYGCSTKKKDKFSKRMNERAKIVPVLMAAKLPYFSLLDSHFRMDKSKECTARIVVYREFRVVNSYTLECSVFGANSQEFTIDTLREIGKNLALSCKGLVNEKVIAESLDTVSEAMRRVRKIKQKRNKIFAKSPSKLILARSKSGDLKVPKVKQEIKDKIKTKSIVVSHKKYQVKVTDDNTYDGSIPVSHLNTNTREKLFSPAKVSIISPNLGENLKFCLRPTEKKKNQNFSCTLNSYNFLSEPRTPVSLPEVVTPEMKSRENFITERHTKSKRVREGFKSARQSSKFPEVGVHQIFK